MVDSDKAKLAFFIGLSLTRVPSFRDGMNDFYSNIAGVALSQALKETPEMAEMAERLGGVKAVAKPWASMKAMIVVAEQVAQSALRKNWQFYVPPKTVPLVTTDNPTLISAGNAGLGSIGPGHPAAELVMNLRKDLAIVSTPKKDYPSMRVFALTPANARKFNRGLVRAARQRVFADHYSPTFDQFVKKYGGEEQRVVGG